VQDAIDLSGPESPPGWRFSLLLLLSIALHALLLGWIANPLRNTETVTGPAKPGPLHLTFLPRPRMQSDTEAHSSPAESSSADLDTGVKKAGGESGTAEQSQTSESATLTPTRDRATSRAILTTARELARQMALQAGSERKPARDDAAKALRQALNPQTETPGVKALADGTIRVVTENGLVYCVRPNEDGRILDPADNLPVSVLCR
jgi:hypothetical protein